MRETQILGGPRPLPTTHWSMIRGTRGPDARAALEVLCRKYWSPVYFHIRRNWTHDIESAKDLAQSFFVALLEKDFLRGVDADKGRFRSFVCAALGHFLLNQKRHDAAEKRTPVPLPAADFDADWKRAVVEAALERLRARAAPDGKERLVDLLGCGDRQHRELHEIEAV
jgi:RNA polymerase sigma-70 factor (ECF subfamily)